MSTLLALTGLAAATLLRPADKKNKEEITQTLEIPPDPPNSVTAETARLVFHVSPLSSKGLLSQQVRDGIKALWKMDKRSAAVKLRAFVAGSGDTRRVQQVVSEMFADKRLPIPALSVIQVGALPQEGAQVVLEATSMARKAVNPHGLAFISGQGVSSGQPLEPMLPLAEKSLDNLRTAVQASGVQPKDVLRVTCFLSRLENVNVLRRQVREAFPEAAANYLQIQRAPLSSVAECEAVGRLSTPPAQPFQLLNPDSLPKSPNYSQIALVNVPKVVLTGAQLAFRYQDSDVRLAFERLGKSLEEAGTTFGKVAMSTIYPLSGAMADKIRSIRFEFYDKSRPPASTMLPFEGLPSLDASFAIEVVAVP